MKKLNIILDDVAREDYKDTVEKMRVLSPEMMSRKFERANVQQAFVLEAVERFAALINKPKNEIKILCVGSYEDTAFDCLLRLGYEIEDIEPMYNYDLNTFFNLPTTVKESYDIVFSTSVLEHVEKDEEFMNQIEQLLKSGGIGIITCDYNDQVGSKIPQGDFRLYTQKDFKERLIPAISNCELLDEPNWQCDKPDFNHDYCWYTFATLSFRKK